MTLRYAPRRIGGEPGWDWFVFDGNRVRAEGWSRGSVRNAEDEAERALARLQRTDIDTDQMETWVGPW